MCKPASSFTCVMCALPGSANLCSREFPLPLAFFLQSEIADFAGRARPSYLRGFGRAAGADERTAARRVRDNAADPVFLVAKPDLGFVRAWSQVRFCRSYDTDLGRL